MVKNVAKKNTFLIAVYAIICVGFILAAFFLFQSYENITYAQRLDKVSAIGYSPDKVISGGPPKDGIPSIDNPQFIPISEVDYIKDNELVLALEYKGEIKVYPFQILVFHEIVNDIVAGDPLAITYCPLCGTGIAYNREVGGEVLEFGVSGKLFNSNMLMYDRNTDSLWTQIDGLAVEGPLIGHELQAIGINTVLWSEWAHNHPEALVLSQDTGYDRQYGDDPYGDYYVTSDIWFPTENKDTSISPKEVIYGIEIGDRHKAYLEEDILTQAPFEDEFAGVSLLVERSDSGEITMTNLDANEEIIFERGFWFSWYAFHPETLVYGKNN